MLKQPFTHGDVLKLWQGSRYLSEAARDIGVPKPRCRRWLAQNNVPPQYWRQLIAAVRTRFDIQITADQLTDAAIHAASAKQSPGGANNTGAQ